MSRSRSRPITALCKAANSGPLHKSVFLSGHKNLPLGQCGMSARSFRVLLASGAGLPFSRLLDVRYDALLSDPAP